jgi:hypothetical protein
VDPLVLFAIPFFAGIAAHNAAMSQYYYADAYRYNQPYTYAMPVVAAPVTGAAIGAGVGALASAARPDAVIAGALIGGIIGSAAATSPVQATMAPRQQPPAYLAPTSRVTSSSSPSTEAFISHWQNFMEPTGHR